ncbi:hypothetical protein B0H63DRAFT_188071 [Podospora didyma]|uniref:Uncharacterized protein n=1 Tax=Podospora didyma TaxID=330526 RepID=A0AAE0U009_9PEZI|nr:hypothetical protein B0H63DRAFT_188071 [Podospora didyma]
MQADTAWKKYGLDEPVLLEYCRKWDGYSTAATVLDVVWKDNQATFHQTHLQDDNALATAITTEPPPGTTFRYIGCEALSANALRFLGHTYNMHLEFWRWVLSHEAADGYWMHSHAGGTVLCFDLTTFEDSEGTGKYASNLLYGGRLRQLSSLHDFGNISNNADLVSEKGKFAYQSSRRVTGYLTPHHGVPVCVILSEDIPNICNDPGAQLAGMLPKLSHIPGMMPPTTVAGLMGEFRALSQQRLEELANDPFAAVVLLEGRIISSWFSFYLKLARDLELTDSMITFDSTDEFLFQKATFIRREVIIALDRFYRHLEAHKGFLQYLIDGTKPTWGPKLVHQEIRDQIKTVDVLKIRTDQLKTRANGISELIFNNINVRQARLTIQQSARSMEMAALQRYDASLSFKQGESMRQLSLLAAVFLPLTLASSLLGMNTEEINGSALRMWVFVPLSFGLILLTALGIAVLARRSEKKTFDPPPNLVDNLNIPNMNMNMIPNLAAGYKLDV